MTSRRRLLKTAVLGTGAAVVGGLAYTAQAARSTAGAAPAAGTGGDPVRPLAFTHPGMLHAQADFDRMRGHVEANTQPWLSGWNRLTANGHSSATWAERPTATIIRGGDGQNYPQLYNDVHAAYQNALRWKVSGDTAHGDKARDILNAWSGTLTTVTGNADRFLASGIYGYQFANAAEIMRGYDGFDLGRFQTMLMDVFYPLCDSFLVNHNDACITNYWANWDLCNMAAIMSFGILNDDQALFDRAVDYFHNGEGNGSLPHAVPHLHGDLAQWQESGRDQGHTIMGIGLMGTLCEMAWNQGVDLYGADGNRFLKACEYVARYNLGNDVPFTPYQWGTGQNCAPREHTVISSAGRGQVRPVWERVYHHYAGRRGLATPNLSAIARANSPEGGGGDYGTTSGGFDELGFGTLAYVR
ncbi:cell wall anchor protein [Streptomyces sp. 3MP-14]|uniref:Cell wall anchor protein n=2 Tax=Streptomyces TaxID=1883 RepID=A0A5N6A1C2_9ACTN|nr:cell wall anchor protein [Streptomyces mimosae]KAB8173729.1 cell wall anchor protein [Streptomyces sp. 3MP-14]